ncbi:type II toxin-antitoxin system HipA family toxin [Cupriavidus sp. UYPR2.512]|uniref:type II toxin-antitoxin system HipA family toxin n=1 Tax=Cupriavidus sp. UYPR2.512 TaxID=1080187 RepID=UPI000381460D|nr:type II toxin-antitoxin system HipA family toxin [Cupriavidus sp. UYPR2.512]UIF88654.1 type II toxin-antitoxin system HipA family toxin [Cupriavidus necator]UIF89122.1 type II toxin-antitoxin system HipA family toxin [Cupriavidus necator]
MQLLHVYRERALVGTLTDPDGSITFQYDPAWIAAQGQALSPHLPVPEVGADNVLYEGAPVQAFFENLLPEGTIREFLGKALHVSPENVVGLLAQLGGDTAGAFSILPAGVTPGMQARYVPVTRADIRGWFTESRGLPLSLKGAQLSALSGVQDKMAVYIDDAGQFFIPIGDAPSTHIVKPAVTHRPDVPDTAVNEAFTMQLARAVGLDVPVVSYDAELDAAIIARYDRCFSAQGVTQRLHQYDLCQALGIASGKKYEGEGGPSFADCFAYVRRHSATPIPDGTRLLQWLAFNLIAGNMDSHAKNLSMLVDPTDQRPRLAPFYDLLNTRRYRHLSQKFAFKVGGEARPEWIRSRHWERFCEDLRVLPKHIRRVMTALVDTVEATLPAVLADLQAQAPGHGRLLQSLADDARREATRLRQRITPSPASATPPAPGADEEMR